MIVRVVGKLASVYASISTSSAKADTSPSISMMLTVLLILRTFITTLACGMWKSPLTILSHTIVKDAKEYGLFLNMPTDISVIQTVFLKLAKRFVFRLTKLHY